MLNAGLTPIPDLNAPGYVPSSVFPPGSDKAIRSAQERYAEGETRRLLDEAMRHLLVIGDEPHPTLPDYERTKWDIALWKDYVRALARARDALRCGACYAVEPKPPLTRMARCSKCRAVRYCSRACQLTDWKHRHRLQCAPAPPERAARATHCDFCRRRAAQCVCGGVAQRDGQEQLESAATADEPTIEPAELAPGNPPQYLCPEGESLPVDPERE